MATSAFCFLSLGAAAGAQADHDATVGSWKPIGPPIGTEPLGADWIELEIPGWGSTVAAISRPDGEGPFPLVLIFHGSAGLTVPFVRWTQEIARAGFVAIAPCWFSGRTGQPASLPIDCPEARPIPPGTSPAAFRSVAVLVATARTLPDVQADRVGLVGHSRGATAALTYASVGGGLRVLAANSGGYPDQLVGVVDGLGAPLLLLHGTKDDPSNGGAPDTGVERARAYETAVRALEKSIEAVYYEGAGHNSALSVPAQGADALRRITTFLTTWLRNDDSPAPPSAGLQQAVQELAPSGVLRVGINYGNRNNGSLDLSTGELSGVGVDLGQGLAARLGIPVRFVGYPGIPAAEAGLHADEWDIYFSGGAMAPWPTETDILPPHLQVPNFYIVADESPIRSNGDADRPGVRIGVARGNNPDVYLTRIALQHVELVHAETNEEARQLLYTGEVDACAGCGGAQREGFHQLDEPFFVSVLGPVIRGNRPAGRAYFREFMEEAKASGLLADAIARVELAATTAGPAR